MGKVTERGNKEKRKPDGSEEARVPVPDDRPANGASLHISDEERLKIVDAVIENMNEGLFLIDEDFKYVMINPASGRILSHDPKQWVGKRAGNYVHPDDRVKSHETVMRTIQGENSSCEVRIMGSDGRYRHLEMHYSLITVGDTFYVLGLVEDITERKAIESELRASEEKYRTLVETQSVAIMTLDLRGSILFANDNFQNVFGYSVTEAHNYNLFNLIHPDEVDRAHKQISQASRGKRIHNMEYRMMTKCGAYVPILMSASPVIDKNGKVVSIIATANDITDLKASEGELKKYRDHLEELVEKRTFKLKVEMAERDKANEALKVTKERLEYVLGVTKTGFDIVDEDYNVVYVDPAWEKILGDYRGKKCYDYFMGSKQPCETCGIPKALKKRTPIIAEEYLKKEDRHIQVHTIPFKTEEGKWLVAEFNVDITERKRAERDVRESEEKYRALFNQASDGIMFMAIDGSSLMVNESFARMHGYSSPAEMERMGLGDLDTPESAKLAPERLKRMIDGETLNFEVDHRHENGHIITLGVHCSLIKIGEKSFFLGFHQDITSRKKAESALIESEKKFRELADNSPNMIFINRMGKVVYANRKCSEMMGYAPDEFLAEGFDFIALVAPEDRKRVAENARKRLDGMESAPYEYTLMTKDHRRFEVLINSKPIRYEGQPAILGIITDVSQLKRVTGQLAETEDLQKNILRTMPSSVIVSDLAGKIIYASEKALALGGYESVAEMHGVAFADFIAPEDRERALADLARLLKTEGPMTGQFRLLRKDGSIYEGEVSTGILKSATGKVRGVLCILNDVTERSRIEKALRESEERYRLITDNMVDEVWLMDMDMNVTFFSPSITRRRGFTVDDFARMQWSDHLTPESLEMAMDAVVEELVPKNLKNGNKNISKRMDLEFKCKDGGTVWSEVTMTVLRDSKGQPTGLLGVAHDIEAQRSARAAIEQSEERYRELADGMFSGLAVYDAVDGGDDFVFVEFNRAAERIEGVRRGDVIGKRVTEAFPGVKEMGIVEVFKRVWITGSPEHIPAALYKDNKIVGWRKNYVYKLPTGEVAAIYEDVTEQRELFESVRESESKYRTLFDMAHDAIFLTDGNRFIDCNLKTLEMFQCTREQIIGQLPHKFSPETQPDGRRSDERAHEYLDAAFAGKPQFFEWTHTRLDGPTFDAEVSLNCVKFKGKDYLLAIVRDITERKKSENELLRLKNFSENVIQNSPVGIMTTDMAGNVTLVNQAMLGILGSPSADKTMDFNVLKIKAMVDQGVSKLFEECILKGLDVAVDNVHYTTVWGKDIDVSIQIVPLKDASSDRQIGTLAMVDDITESTRVSRELTTSETKLHNILNSMDDLVFGFDAEGRFNFYHAPKGGPLYAPPEAFVGKHFTDILPPPVAKMTSEAFERAKGGEVSEFEYTLDIGGVTHCFIAKVSPTMERGHYRGAVAVVRDITERKASEEAIRGSEERLKALFHASIDGIGVESRGKYAYANPSFASMHGYADADELVGVKVSATIAPEDRKRMADYTSARETGTHAPNRYQYKALRKDGTIFDAEISISEYMLGHELFIVGFVKDVTEQKRRQSDEVQRQILEAQFKLKSVITDIVPVMLGSMSKEGRADLVEKLSERLDSVLLDKYPKEMAPTTVQEVAGAYIGVLADLGGKSLMTCPDEVECKKNKVACPDACSVTISVCPWDNRKARNILLCVLCRGIAWRFASRSKKSIDVQLVKSMADGEKRCLIELKEEKD